MKLHTDISAEGRINFILILAEKIIHGAARQAQLIVDPLLLNFRDGGISTSLEMTEHIASHTEVATPRIEKCPT